MTGVADVVRNRPWITALLAALVATVVAASVFDVPVERLVTVGAIERTLQSAAPIALAAIGGLYAEKSGVFNIGLEGFLIFGAVLAVVGAWIASGGSDVTVLDLWAGVLLAVVVCTVLGFVFALFTIRYRADQIVAGLAVWFIALGLGPFAANVVWDSVSSPPVANVPTIPVPVLADLPWIGPVLFDASPFVYITLVVTVAAWIVLTRTRVGYWIQAAGENPEALATAGIDVNRVRYATVTVSGALCGLGGAALSVGFIGGFTGTGVTMVDGRGWIAITAYLFANYHPLGVLGASLLFGATEALQVQLQTIGITIPQSLIGLFPYVVVLVVLVLVGRTRMPSAVGESYERDD